MVSRYTRRLPTNLRLLSPLTPTIRSGTLRDRLEEPTIMKKQLITSIIVGLIFGTIILIGLLVSGVKPEIGEDGGILYFHFLAFFVVGFIVTLVHPHWD